MHSSSQLNHNLVSVDDVLPISASDDVGDELAPRAPSASPLPSLAPNPLLAQLPWQAIDDVRPFSDPDPISESVSSSSASSPSSAPIAAPRAARAKRSNLVFGDGQMGAAARPLAVQPSIRPTSFAPRDRGDVLSSVDSSSAASMPAPSLMQSVNRAFNPLAKNGPSSIIESQLRENSSDMRAARKTGWAADGLGIASTGASIGGAALSATGIGAIVGAPLLLGGQIGSSIANTAKAGSEEALSRSILSTNEHRYGDDEQRGVLQTLSDKHKDAATGAAYSGIGSAIGGAASAVISAATKAAKIKSVHDTDSDESVRAYAANIQNSKQEAEAQAAKTNALKKSGGFSTL